MTDISKILDSIKNHEFVFHEVTNTFCTSSNFTRAEIPTEPIQEMIGSASTEKCVLLKTLFDLSSVQNCLPDHVKEFLQQEFQSVTTPKRMSETTAVLDLTRRLLLPLFKKVTLESKTYSTLVSGGNVEAAPIGIGSKKTLHGTPDMKVDDLLCLYMPCASEDEEEEVEEGNDEISSGLGSGSTGKDDILYPYIVSLQICCCRKYRR
jgi:hypothetical protein